MNAVFVPENNGLSAMLRCRAGHIVVPSAPILDDRQRFICTIKEAEDHLRKILRNKTISRETATAVWQQIRAARVRNTMQEIVTEIDEFKPYNRPKKSMHVDVCECCGAHALLSFSSITILAGSIEMAFHSLWQLTQQGELHPRIAAIALQLLRDQGPLVAIHTNEMSEHVRKKLRLVMGFGDTVLEDDLLGTLLQDSKTMNFTTLKSCTQGS